MSYGEKFYAQGLLLDLERVKFHYSLKMNYCSMQVLRVFESHLNSKSPMELRSQSAEWLLARLLEPLLPHFGYIQFVCVHDCLH